jgi:hypothetical protein
MTALGRFDSFDPSQATGWFRRILVVRVRLGEGRVSTPFRPLDFALVNVGFGSTSDILHLTERVSFAPACRRSDQLLQSFP